MLKFTRTLLATAAIAGLPVVASAQDDMFDMQDGNWYVGVGLGANWLDDLSGSTLTPPPTPLVTPVDLEFDDGWVMIGSLGYAWDNLRLEFELGYRDNDSETFTTAGLTGNAYADVTQFSQMLNLIWDIPLGENLALSLGAGAGGVLLEMNGGGTTGAGSTLVLDDDDYVFAYQGIAGLSYDISDNMEIFAEYRFFGVDEFQASGVISPAALPVVLGDDDIENQSAILGVRYYFGAAEPEPLPPAPVEQSQPIAPAPKTFIVFFDFNKSNLTGEAQSVVAEAADAYRQTGSVRVKVTGHTDTVGSNSYNQALSERRASSVQAELERLGVPADAIATEGRSFSDPMVPTGPGVREPQNRRAVIDLQEAGA